MFEEVGVGVDMLEEFVVWIGIDVGGLVEIVVWFNVVCVVGDDFEFGCGCFCWGVYMSGDCFYWFNFNFGLFLEGFYYVVEFSWLVSLGIVLVGVVVDEYVCVVGWNGEIIDGFYFVGNLVVWFDNGVVM